MERFTINVTSDKMFENSASYYKNEFLNNCKCRLNVLRKLPSKLEILANEIMSLFRLENQKDPQEKKYSEDIQVIMECLNECARHLENYIEICKEEFNRLKEKDFEKIIEDQKKSIEEKIKNEQ